MQCLRRCVTAVWVSATLLCGAVCVALTVRDHPPQKALVGVVICSLGDVIAQLMGGAFDVRRALIFLCWGVIGTTQGIVWYDGLSRVVVGTAISSQLLKVALDQLVFTPALAGPSFAMWVELLRRGIGSAEPVAAVKRQMWKQLIAGWKLWPIVHTVNFALTPPEWQMYVVWCFGLFWSVLTSLMANEARSAKRE